MSDSRRVICISNVASQRGVGQAAALTEALAELPNVQQLVTANVEQLHERLAAVQLTATDLLVVNGGDGSLQAALSWLTARLDARASRLEVPMIAALPGGSTNMSAYDINQHRRFEACLQGLVEQLTSSAAPTLLDRPVLRVRDAQHTRVGFFCGVGAIVQGIEYCHAQLYAAGAKRREFTAGIAMARAIWGVLRKQPPFADSQPISLAAFGSETATAQTPQTVLNPDSGVLMFAASTLQRLLVGARPHWGDEPGALRFTLVERDRRGLWFRLPGLLGIGKIPRPLASAGYHSHNCHWLELSMSGGYTIDGELFTPETNQITIDAQQTFRFLPL